MSVVRRAINSRAFIAIFVLGGTTYFLAQLVPPVTRFFSSGPTTYFSLEACLQDAPPVENSHPLIRCEDADRSWTAIYQGDRRALAPGPVLNPYFPHREDAEITTGDGYKYHLTLFVDRPLRQFGGTCAPNVKPRTENLKFDFRFESVDGKNPEIDVAASAVLDGRPLEGGVEVHEAEGSGWDSSSRASYNCLPQGHTTDGRISGQFTDLPVERGAVALEVRALGHDFRVPVPATYLPAPSPTPAG